MLRQRTPSPAAGGSYDRPGDVHERRDRLPPQPTPLIGRHEALAECERTLAGGARLLTLTGPGGTGKTRLAVALASALAGRFAHGASFVDLSAIADPRLVPNAIAHALSIRDAGDRPLVERLAHALRQRELLLVLDNLEQLLPEAADAVAALLSACPRLTVLATSRAPIGLRWEHEHPVEPLDLPPTDRPASLEEMAEVPAVALFVERARAARPGFTLTAENAAAVAHVCRLLDGLPLAIELTAARVRLFGPAALAARLDAHRLEDLTGGARDLPRRHHSLAATIAWSETLLTPEEQALFRRLGVFAGGWTLASAAAVAVVSDSATEQDVLAGLASLVNHGLVRPSAPRDPSAESRFHMLETIRAYALERLEAHGEGEATRRRHAAHLLALVEQAEPLLRGAQADTWLDRLDREHDNVRAALRWCIDRGEAEMGARLGGALWRYWVIRGHLVEGQCWLDEMLGVAGPDVPPAARARVLTAAGEMAWARSDLDRAAACHEAALALRRNLADPAGVAQSLQYLGNLAMERGDLPRARALHEEALPLWRRLGSAADLALSLRSLGRLAALAGDYATARRLLEESRREAERTGSDLIVAAGLQELSEVVYLEGRVEEAAEAAAASLEVALRRGARASLARRLEWAGVLAARLGHAETAARLLATSEALRTAIGAARMPSEAQQADEALAAARARLGAAATEAALAGGRWLTPERAVAEALAVLRAETPQPPAAELGPPGGLSARELEVARLVTRGLTNRQIADILVITEGTAINHVTHILRKLGFQTRAQIAAWVVEQGLEGPARP